MIWQQLAIVNEKKGKLSGKCKKPCASEKSNLS
jgi:hypothetical protein